MSSPSSSASRTVASPIIRQLKLSHRALRSKGTRLGFCPRKWGGLWRQWLLFGCFAGRDSGFPLKELLVRDQPPSQVGVVEVLQGRTMIQREARSRGSRLRQDHKHWFHPN